MHLSDNVSDIKIFGFAITDSTNVAEGPILSFLIGEVKTSSRVKFSKTFIILNRISV